MNRKQKFTKNIRENAVDYYVVVLLALAIPLVIGNKFGLWVGLLTSFVIQVVIGVFYIRAKVGTK